MSIRFRKSVSLTKGVRLNFSKSGIGISAGVKGARIGVGSKGAYVSSGIPGTGLYSVSYLNKGENQVNSWSSLNPKVDKPLAVKIILGFLLFLILLFFPPVALVLLLGVLVYYFIKGNSPVSRAEKNCKNAVALFKQGNYSQAEQLLQEAKQLNPENKKAVALLGAVLYNQQKYKEAVEYFEVALSTSPSDENLIIPLANSYFNLGEFDKVIALIQKSLSNWESNLKALQLLGLSFANKKKYDLAIEVFKKAPLKKQILDDDLIETHYNFGLVYEASGDKENALKHFNRVYAYDASYKDVNEKIKGLERN